jgi:hypothetical protein
VVAWRREAGGEQDGAELVPVEVGDVGLVIDAGPADVHRRVAEVFEVTGKAFDVDTADVEQVVLVLPHHTVNWRKSKA